MIHAQPLRNYALLGLLALLWGASYNFAKVAVQTIPPITTTALRVAIAAAILVMIVRRTGVTLFAAEYSSRSLFVQAWLINIVPWTLSAWAAQTIDSGLVTILNSTSPLFAFVITWGITRHEPATTGKLIGALGGLSGVVLIVGVGMFSALGNQLPQQLACIAGAVMFGIAAVHGRHFDSMPALAVATQTLLFASAVLVPLSLIVDRPWTLMPSAQSIGAIFCLAVFSSAAAVVVYYRILSAMGSMAAASQSYLRIVVGVTIGVVFLDESLTWERFAGMLLIFGGVIAMTRPHQPSA